MVESAHPDPPIRLLIVDDHPAVRAGLCAVLGQEPDFVVVAEAADGAEAVMLTRMHRPDIVLMDLRMPVMDGVEATRVITSESPTTRILALTMHGGDGDIRPALAAGAQGYLFKDMLLTDVTHSLRAVYRGERVIPIAVASRLAEYPEGHALSPREVEVLGLVATGLGNREIAETIGRTQETVKVHLKNIFAKLAVSGRTEAVTAALARGILRLD